MPSLDNTSELFPAGERRSDELRELRERLAQRTRQLRRAEARFRDIIERNADAQIVVDRDGIIQFANAAAGRLLGGGSVLVGTPFGFPLVEGETTEIELARSGCVAEMRVVRTEWEGQLAFIASLRDITERKRAQERDRQLLHEHAARLAAEEVARRAEEANRRKVDFLATVSHDLRTPLSAIVGYADLLEMGIPTPIPESSRERVGRIKTSARHLQYLLNELLSYARLEAGHDEPRWEQADLAAIVRDVASVVEPLASERALGLSVDAPTAPVLIRTDVGKAHQILLNLAANAVKYTRKGGVRLALRLRDGEVDVEVSDTGDGIAQEHLELIFEPFWQVDRTQRAHGGGTGLGLAVVKHLVESLRGRISVNSSLGEGSVFTVTLPTHAPTDAGAR
jgi:signal transduction histidine kinase